MARLAFRPSRTETRPATAAPRVSWVQRAAGGMAIGGLVLFLYPLFRTPRAPSVLNHFNTHRKEFNALRDLIATEPSLGSVGVDNVGDFWLFDGRWTASGNRFLAFSRSEMLETVGLSPRRYQTYTDLLHRAGAYRVTRQNPRGAVLRGTVFLFPQTFQRGRREPVIVFADHAPGPLVSLDRAERAKPTAYAQLDTGWYVVFSRR